MCAAARIANRAVLRASRGQPQPLAAGPMTRITFPLVQQPRTLHADAVPYSVVVGDVFVALGLLQLRSSARDRASPVVHPLGRPRSDTANYAQLQMRHVRARFRVSVSGLSDR